MLLTFKFQTPSSTTFLFNILARQLINHLTYSCCISKFTTFRHSPCYVFLQIELECFLIEWLMVGWGSASIESNYAFCFIFFSILFPEKTTSTKQILLLHLFNGGRRQQRRRLRLRRFDASLSNIASRLFKENFKVSDGDFSWWNESFNVVWERSQQFNWVLKLLIFKRVLDEGQCGECVTWDILGIFLINLILPQGINFLINFN